MPPLLLEASRPETSSPECKAAEEALKKVSAAVGEEGVYLLIGQLEKGLEDPAKRLAAANSIKVFCESTRLDYQEHVSSLITVRPWLIARLLDCLTTSGIPMLAAFNWFRLQSTTHLHSS
jgi:hypothetical protein